MRRGTRRLIGAITIALGLPLAMVGGAGARYAANTIGPEATLSGGGHRAQGTVLLNCTAGQQTTLTLTLTQGDVTGTGNGGGLCTGELESYPVTVAAQGPEPFQPGTAQACATGLNRNRGTIEDSVQWCRDGGVTLVAG